MTTAQVVETSVTNISLSEDYSHPDDKRVDLLYLAEAIFLNKSRTHSSEQQNTHTAFADKKWQQLKTIQQGKINSSICEISEVSDRPASAKLPIFF